MHEPTIKIKDPTYGYRIINLKDFDPKIHKEATEKDKLKITEDQDQEPPRTSGKNAGKGSGKDSGKDHDKDRDPMIVALEAHDSDLIESKGKIVLDPKSLYSDPEVLKELTVLLGIPFPETITEEALDECRKAAAEKVAEILKG